MSTKSRQAMRRLRGLCYWTLTVGHRHLRAGDFYELLPPEGDIHRVRALGDQPSVSLHLLGNDVDCIWRHRYEPQEYRVYPFRSGYGNEPCIEEESHG